MLSQELLNILCCPKCHGELLYLPEKETLTCKKCGRVYLVKDNIPIMLPNDGATGAADSRDVHIESLTKDAQRKS